MKKYQGLLPYGENYYYCKNCDARIFFNVIDLFPPESIDSYLYECYACKTKYTMKQLEENWDWWMEFLQWYDKYKKPLIKKRAAEIANKTQEEWERIHRYGGLPDNIESVVLTWNSEGYLLPNILKDSGMVNSTSDARRLIEQGAVLVNGEKMTDISTYLSIDSEEYLIKIGKRRFKKVVPKEE